MSSSNRYAQGTRFRFEEHPHTYFSILLRSDSLLKLFSMRVTLSVGLHRMAFLIFFSLVMTTVLRSILALDRMAAIELRRHMELLYCYAV